MSDSVDVRPVDDSALRHRRSTLLVPAVIATCVGVSLLALYLASQVLVQVVLHSHPGILHPRGTIYVPPSHSERARAIAREATSMIACVVLIVLTWRLRSQGRAVATYVCAVAVILTGVASYW